MSSHRLTLGSFPANEVDRIAKHARKREGRKEGKDWSRDKERRARGISIVPKLSFRCLNNFNAEDLFFFFFPL